MRVRLLNKAKWEEKSKALERAAKDNDIRKEMSQKCLEELLRISFEIDQVIESGSPAPTAVLISWLDRMNVSLILELTGKYADWEDHLRKKELKDATDEGIVKEDDSEKHR